MGGSFLVVEICSGFVIILIPNLESINPTDQNLDLALSDVSHSRISGSEPVTLFSVVSDRGCQLSRIALPSVCVYVSVTWACVPR